MGWRRERRRGDGGWSFGCGMVRFGLGGGGNFFYSKGVWFVVRLVCIV